MAEPTEQQLMQALRKADAAGDVPAAQAIARRIQAIRSRPAKTAEELTGTSIDPTEGQSFMQNAWQGLGKSMADLPRGIAQLFAEGGGGNPLVIAADAATGGKASEMLGYRQLSEALRNQQAAVDERDAPLMETGGGITGNVAGQALQIIAPGGIAKTGALGLARMGAQDAPKLAAVGNALLAPRLGGSMGLAAAQAGVQPVSEDGERLENAALAGAGGGAGYGLAKGLGMLFGKAFGIGKSATGAGNVEREAAERLLSYADNPDAVKSAIAQGRGEIVPGAVPTLAENTGDLGLIQLQRALDSTREFNREFTSQQLRNNTARVRYLEGAFGGADDAAIDAAATARDRAADPLRKTAMKATGVDTGRLVSRVRRAVSALETRPAVQKPLREVESLLVRQIPDAERLKTAQEPLQAFLSGGRKSAADFDAVSEAARILRKRDMSPEDALEAIKGIRATSKGAQEAILSARAVLRRAEAGRDDVAGLYNVRKSIDDMLSGNYGGDKAFATAASNELMAIKRGLDRVITKTAPEFGMYLDAYRAGSKVVDQAKIGKQLLSGARTRLNAFDDAQLSPAQFAKQAQDLDAVARQATGFRKAKAADILTPQQQQVVDDVRRDLDRLRVARDTTKPAGSQTNQLRNFDVEMAQAMPSALAGLASGDPIVAMVGKRIVADIQRRHGDEVVRVLQEAMLDPDRAAQIIGKLPPPVQREILVALGGIGRIGATVGSAAVAQGAVTGQ